MNDDQLNRELHEKLGWIELEHTSVGWAGNTPISWTWERGDEKGDLLGYCGDMNACHEARQYLTTPEHKVRYQSHLYKLAEAKAETRNKAGQGIVSDYDAHTQGPREIAEAIYYALGGKL